MFSPASETKDHPFQAAANLSCPSGSTPYPPISVPFTSQWLNMAYMGWYQTASAVCLPKFLMPFNSILHRLSQNALNGPAATITTLSLHSIVRSNQSTHYRIRPSHKGKALSSDLESHR